MKASHYELIEENKEAMRVHNKTFKEIADIAPVLGELVYLSKPIQDGIFPSSMDYKDVNVEPEK